MRRFLLAALLVLFSSTLAQAQVANRPTFSVGDTWTFTKRLPWMGEEARLAKVEESSGAYVVVRPNSSCPSCNWLYDKDSDPHASTRRRR